MTESETLAGFIGFSYAVDGRHVCANCAFSRYNEHAVQLDERGWECRKKAPRLDPDPLNHFPRMFASDSCGAWDADPTPFDLARRMAAERGA